MHLSDPIPQPRLKPSKVGVPLLSKEADLLLDLTRQVPMTTPTTVAKIAMMYGLQQLKPDMVEALITQGLARRPGRTRLVKRTP